MALTSLPAKTKIAQVTDISDLQAEIARLDGRIDNAGANVGGIADVPGLQSALDAKAGLAGPAFTSSPTAPTPTPGDNSTKLSTTAFVQAAIAALVQDAPETLSTLNAIADALANDPNLATTLTQQIASKQDALTGVADVPGLVAALSTKQAVLTALSDVPGLVAALAAKQPASAALDALAARTIGIESASSLLTRGDGDARFARVFGEMPGTDVGADGDWGLLDDASGPLLIRKEGGAWGPSVRTMTTRMTETGTFRNGPGIYTGLTVVSGSGSIVVYDGPDAAIGQAIHMIASASVGSYPLASTPITNGWVVLGAGLVVDMKVDD